MGRGSSMKPSELQIIRKHQEDWHELGSDTAFARYLSSVYDDKSTEAWRWQVRTFRRDFPDEVPETFYGKASNLNKYIPKSWEGTASSLSRKLHAEHPEISIKAWEARIHNAKLNNAITIIEKNEFTTTHLKGMSQGIEDLWASVEELSSKSINNMESARWAEITFNTKGYIGVALASDQHIGNSYTDHARMREDAELVRDTDNCFVIHAGDFIDNFMIDKPRPAMKQKIPPSVQWKLCDHYLDMFEDKILAVVAGNHDLWTSGATDYDPLAKKVADLDVIYHAHELNIRLLVNNIPYNFSIRHKRRGNSALNPARVIKKMWEDGECDFDIGVVGHHHTPVIEPFTRHGMERWAIRPGSYKLIDSFAEMIGFQKERATCPMVILSPDKRSIQVFSDLRDGVATLKTLNGGK